MRPSKTTRGRARPKVRHIFRHPVTGVDVVFDWETTDPDLLCMRYAQCQTGIDSKHIDRIAEVSSQSRQNRERIARRLLGTSNGEGGER